MFDVMYNETVTVQRIATIDGRGAQTWTNVSAPAGMTVRIERTRRRTVGPDGTEFARDAAMMYRKSDAPDLRTEDRVVTSDGKTYRVVQIVDQELLFHPGLHYARADMALNREP